MARKSVARIALLIDTSTGWGRRLIRGVIGYTQKHDPSDIWIRPRGQREHLRLPPDWVGEGIIARISDHATARHVAAAGVPVVNVSGIKLDNVNWCRVTTSLRATGQLAAEHLLNCGLQHFVYAALPRLSYVRHQYQGFADVLERAGHACPSYQPSFQPNSRKGWTTQQRELAQSIRIEPAGVTARQSTDLLAIEDQDLARAIRFIRDHAAQPIDVRDVLREVAISRRALERGFQKVLGRSPAAEIRRQHLDRARRLLTETDLSIPEVAAASGFGSPTHFAHIFKSEVGQSPLKYRSATRAR